MSHGFSPIIVLGATMLLVALHGVACSSMHKADPQNPIPSDPTNAASRVVICTEDAAYDPSTNECVRTSGSTQ